MIREIKEDVWIYACDVVVPTCAAVSVHMLERVHLILQGSHQALKVVHFLLTLPQQILIGLELIRQLVEGLL